MAPLPAVETLKAIWRRIYIQRSCHFAFRFQVSTSHDKLQQGIILIATLSTCSIILSTTIKACLKLLKSMTPQAWTGTLSTWVRYFYPSLSPMLTWKWTARNVPIAPSIIAWRPTTRKYAPQPVFPPQRHPPERRMPKPPSPSFLNPLNRVNAIITRLRN